MFFELVGEIIDVVIADSLCNLRKVQITLPNHPLGFAYTDVGQVCDDRGTGLLFVDMAQLGNADIEFIGEVLQRNVFLIVFRQMVFDILCKFFMAVQPLEGHTSLSHMNVVVPPINQDEQLLQTVADDLFAAEGCIFPLPHIDMRRCLIEVFKRGFGFLDQCGEALFFRIVQEQDLVFKSLHIGAVTVEGDDDNIDGTVTGNLKGMEFMGAVEGQFTGFQKKLLLFGSDDQFTFVHVDQFPTGVALTGKDIIPGQLVVCDIDKFRNRKYRCEFVRFKYHMYILTE